MNRVKLGDICTKASSNIKQSELLDNEGDYPIYGASGFIKSVDFYMQEKPYVAVVKDGAGVGRVMKLPAYSSVIGTMQYIIPNDDVDVSYLAYAMEHMNLSKYYMGAAIPHIYFKDYKEEKLYAYDLNDQLRIVSILDIVVKTIETQRKQTEKLDELIKSRFVEMFGDPVANPKAWIIKPLKSITTKIGSGATPKGGKESYSEKGISLIRSMNVHNGRFEYKDLAHINDEQAEALNNVTVEHNDILLNITGASVARSCIVPSDVIPARVNQHVCIIRCVDGMNPIFINAILISESYQHLLWEIAGSGATREAITKQQIEMLSIICPPIELQNQFDDFVTKVEQQKATVQKSIDRLETLKKSLMQEFFG